MNYAADAPRIIIPDLGEIILHGFDAAKLKAANILRMAMSAAVERKMLDHLSTKTAYTPAANYLALTTVAVANSDTAASITEANYTGYARKAVAAADWNAASGANPATITTAVAEIFAACTAGSSIVIGWAICTTASGAGDILQYGTATSTTISTTQTPAQVAAGNLSVSLV